MNDLFTMINDNFGRLGVLLIAAAMVFHLIMTLRNKGRVDGVQAALYEQLRAELVDARTEIAHLIESIGHMRDDKTILREQIITLQHRVESLEECEETVRLLRLRLQEKDDTIHEQQIENKLLHREIAQLKDRIHHLELRLAQDEARFPGTGDADVQ